MDYDNLTYVEAKAMIKEADDWLSNLQQALGDSYAANPSAWHIGGGAALGAGLGGLSSAWQPKKRRNTLGRMLTGGLLGGLGGFGTDLFINSPRVADAANEQIEHEGIRNAGRNAYNQLRDAQPPKYTVPPSSRARSAVNSLANTISNARSSIGGGVDAVIDGPPVGKTVTDGAHRLRELIDGNAKGDNSPETTAGLLESLPGVGQYLDPHSRNPLENPTPLAAGAAAGAGYLYNRTNSTPRRATDIPGLRPGHRSIWEETTHALQEGTTAEQALANTMDQALAVEKARSSRSPRAIWDRLMYGAPARRVLLGRGMAPVVPNPQAAVNAATPDAPSVPATLPNPHNPNGRPPRWAGAVRKTNRQGIGQKLGTGAKAGVIMGLTDLMTRALQDHFSGRGDVAHDRAQLEELAKALGVQYSGVK